MTCGTESNPCVSQRDKVINEEIGLKLELSRLKHENSLLKCELSSLRKSSARMARGEHLPDEILDEICSGRISDLLRQLESEKEEVRRLLKTGHAISKEDKELIALVLEQRKARGLKWKRFAAELGYTELHLKQSLQSRPRLSGPLRENLKAWLDG